MRKGFILVHHWTTPHLKLHFLLYLTLNAQTLDPCVLPLSSGNETAAGAKASTTTGANPIAAALFA